MNAPPPTVDPHDGLPGYKRARRDQIVAAAMAALKEHDYDQIQMRDVADRADVALGTLYRYFSSKEHVYAAVLTAWGSGALARPCRPNGRRTPIGVRRLLFCGALRRVLPPTGSRRRGVAKRCADRVRSPSHGGRRRCAG